MRILEIISGASVNGTTQHGLLLSRELARRGHTVTVVCRPRSWIGTELTAEPIAVVESDLHRWPPDELWRMVRLVRHQQIDILHTHSSGAHSFGALLRWLSGVPCIATAHAENRHWHWGLNDRVIAVSEATRRFLRTHTSTRHSRIEVVPNFVCPTRFTTVSPHTRVLVRTSFGIPTSALVLGFVGSLYHGKGWDDLLPVFAQVREVVPDTRLLAVGDGKPAYRAALEQKATRLGVAENIIWAGFRRDIPELLAAVDIFVSPSRQETFGLSVLEAMAAGCPVVAMAVGGVPELVHHEVTGLLVPPGDLVALRHVLVTLMQDEPQRRKLGEAGQQRVRECFTADIQLPRFEEICARTIRSRR